MSCQGVGDKEGHVSQISPGETVYITMNSSLGKMTGGDMNNSSPNRQFKGSPGVWVGKYICYILLGNSSFPNS